MNDVLAGTRFAEVDWSTLEHAYGDASDVPGWIKGLTVSETFEESLHELWAAVLHQGTLYDSTMPAMVSIASLLGARQTADAENTSWLLLMYADAVRDYESVEFDAETRTIVRDARASLGEIATLVRPLIADDGSEAAAAALLQAEAATTEAAATEMLAQRACARPAGQVEQACVAALTSLGVETSAILADGESGLEMAARLARVGMGSTEASDLDALVAEWDLAVEVAPHIAIGVGNLPEWLSAVNPAASVTVLGALPMPDEAMVAGLVDIVVGSRRHAPAAIRRLLAVAALPEAPPELMIEALRQCPPTREVCDQLVAVAERVSAGARATIGSSTADTDARADSALALLRAGDGRWPRPMAQALLTNPAARTLMVATSASAHAALGSALLQEHAPATTMLLAAVRQALRRQPSADETHDFLGPLVTLLGSWPVEAAAGAVPEVRELLAIAPRQVADALANWDDVESIDRVRDAAATGDAIVLLALARLTKDPDDFHRVLDADLRFSESAVLAHWDDRTDPRFLGWCRSIIGTAPAPSNYQRENQLAALRVLAAADPADAAGSWSVLRDIIESGRGPIDEAIGLAVDWRAREILPQAAVNDFEALLAALVAGRKGDGQPSLVARAAAALAILDLELPLPGTPARISKIVGDAVGDQWARDLGLRLAEHLANAPAATRSAAAKRLRSLVERDERFETTRDVAVEDERTLVRLRGALQRLSA